MLVLTRKNQQSIKVDGPCVITVVCTGSRRVRLGIQAEPEVKILRAELEDAEEGRGGFCKKVSGMG